MKNKENKAMGWSILLFLIASIAWAGSKSLIFSQGAGTTSIATALSKTSGIPSQHQDGTDLKAVHITVSTPDDAGQGAQIQGCILRGYKYTVQNVASDGGVGYAWSRYPKVDLYTLAYDAGVETAQKYSTETNGGITFSLPGDGLSVTSLPPMANGSRLAWVTEWCVYPDAGLPATSQLQMVTSGVY